MRLIVLVMILALATWAWAGLWFVQEDGDMTFVKDENLHAFVNAPTPKPAVTKDGRAVYPIIAYDIPSPGFEHLGKDFTAHILGDYYLAGELQDAPQITTSGRNETTSWVALWMPTSPQLKALNIYRNDNNTLVGWIPVVVKEKP